MTKEADGRLTGNVVPVEGAIDILYEDDALICLDKPPLIPAHPSPGHKTDTLANRLAAYYLEKDEPHKIHVIGRLDMEASGAILFAKTAEIAQALEAQKKKGEIEKEYVALCKGYVGETGDTGVVDRPIAKVKDANLLREVRDDGDPAVTRYLVEEQFAQFARVRLTLETGRTHQIRVHMASIGHPLIGDTLYGDDGFGLTHAALHADVMRLTHPVTGEKLTFRAPAPKDVAELTARAAERKSDCR